MHVSHHSSHYFFRNKEMNGFYFSYGIFQFALGLIAVFVPIYLYQQNFSLPEILLYYMLVSIYFVIFSFLSARIVARIGVKHTMFLAVPLNVIYFIGLKYIATVHVLFFLLPLFKAIKMQFYNYGFHLNFIEHSDQKKEGREVAILQSSALIASGLAPFIGGFIAAVLGFQWLFFIGSIVLALSMIPLLIFKESYEKITFKKWELFSNIFKKHNRANTLSFTGYAIESWIGFILWPLFLYMVLENTKSVGSIISLTILLTILVSLYVGKKADSTNKVKMLRLGTILYFFAWVSRLFAYNFSSIFFIDTYKNISGRFVYIPWTAHFYEQAKKRDYFSFIVEREITFHLVRILIMPILILIFALDIAPYQIAFSIAAISSLLYAVSLYSEKPLSKKEFVQT